MYNRKELELMEKNKHLSKLTDNLIAERNTLIDQLETLQDNYNQLAAFKVDDLIKRIKKK